MNNDGEVTASLAAALQHLKGIRSRATARIRTLLPYTIVSLVSFPRFSIFSPGFRVASQDRFCLLPESFFAWFHRFPCCFPGSEIPVSKLRQQRSKSVRAWIFILARRLRCARLGACLVREGAHGSVIHTSAASAPRPSQCLNARHGHK